MGKKYNLLKKEIFFLCVFIQKNLYTTSVILGLFTYWICSKLEKKEELET